MNQKSKIFHLTLGDHGPWVTLINGHARTHRDFRNLSQQLINHGFRVLLLDNRGSGDSTVEEPFEMTDMVQDVVDLWTQLEITSSYVLGISMGGMIALSLATSSNIPKALILVSTAASLEFYRANISEWATDQQGVISQLKPYFDLNFFESNKLLVAAMAKQLVQSHQADHSQNTLQRAAIKRFQLEDDKIAGIQIPTLVIHGEEDQIISSKAADHIQEKIKGSVNLRYQQTGHLILAERPTRFYEDVIKFLKSQNG
ncbi:MAG: alpha/beta hydrolase [Pseudomonadota bacterium]